MTCMLSAFWEGLLFCTFMFSAKRRAFFRNLQESLFLQFRKKVIFFVQFRGHLMKEIQLIQVWSVPVRTRCVLLCIALTCMFQLYCSLFRKTSIASVIIHRVTIGYKYTYMLKKLRGRHRVCQYNRRCWHHQHIPYPMPYHTANTWSAETGVPVSEFLETNSGEDLILLSVP